MKHKIITLNNNLYQGYHIQVNINELQNIDFKELWNKLFELTKASIKDIDEFYIGYEDYKNFTQENKIFDYYALAPFHFFIEKDNDLITMNLDKGEYILFENKISTHGPDFFKRAYKYIKDNKISVKQACDFEFIPISFDFDNPNSLIYVGLYML